MGRSSGFIAMHASLASGQIDICLIPEVLHCNFILSEVLRLYFNCILIFQPDTDIINIWTTKVPFQIHGPHGILHHLKYLIETKGSAVVCVAEGAGQVNFKKKLRLKSIELGLHVEIAKQFFCSYLQINVFLVYKVTLLSYGSFHAEFITENQCYWCIGKCNIWGYWSIYSTRGWWLCLMRLWF